jgi:hypothetical protein
MTEIVTVVRVPGVFGSGLMLYGRHDRETIVEMMRDNYETILADAETVLAMSSEDYIVEICRGVHKQEFIELLPYVETKGRK